MLMVGLCLGVGCDRSAPVQRQYKEARVLPERPAAAPAMGGGTGMAAGGGSGMKPAVEVTWAKPDGWDEHAGSGVRIATFHVDGHECSLTAFPGDVGGEAANLRRWLGQIGVPDPDPATLDKAATEAAAITSRGGLPGRIFVLTGTGDDPGADAMLAAILRKEDASVFVKLVAPQSALDSLRPGFTALCESLE